MAEDIGIARHACQCASRAEVDFRSSATRGADSRARSGKTRAEAGDQQVVEGRAARRLHRLQPEREGSDRRLCVVSAADA